MFVHPHGCCMELGCGSNSCYCLHLLLQIIKVDNHMFQMLQAEIYCFIIKSRRSDLILLWINKKLSSLIAIVNCKSHPLEYLISQKKSDSKESNGPRSARKMQGKHYVRLLEIPWRWGIFGWRKYRLHEDGQWLGRIIVFFFVLKKLVVSKTAIFVIFCCWHLKLVLSTSCCLLFVIFCSWYLPTKTCLGFFAKLGSGCFLGKPLDILNLRGSWLDSGHLLLAKHGHNWTLLDHQRCKFQWYMFLLENHRLPLTVFIHQMFLVEFPVP